MGEKWLEWYWRNDGFKDENHLHNKHKRCTCGNHSFNILDKRDKSRELYIKKREWTDELNNPFLRRHFLPENKLRRLRVMIEYGGKPKPKFHLFTSI